MWKKCSISYSYAVCGREKQKKCGVWRVELDPDVKILRTPAGLTEPLVKASP